MLHKAYAVKIDDYTVNLTSAWEVKELLQAVVAQYDSTGYYRVNLINDIDREINVLTASVTDMTPEKSAVTLTIFCQLVELMQKFVDMPSRLNQTEKKDLTNLNMAL